MEIYDLFKISNCSKMFIPSIYISYISWKTINQISFSKTNFLHFLFEKSACNISIYNFSFLHELFDFRRKLSVFSSFLSKKISCTQMNKIKFFNKQCAHASFTRSWSSEHKIYRCLYFNASVYPI